MAVVATVLVLLVAALHAYFMLLEMVFWTKPLGLEAFGQTPATAEASKTLAANQGLYNGFLVAGLLWGVIVAYTAPATSPGGFAIECFFLVCVIVAGVFGGLTASRKILYVQALPGAIALVAVFVARSG